MKIGSPEWLAEMDKLGRGFDVVSDQPASEDFYSHQPQPSRFCMSSMDGTPERDHARHHHLGDGRVTADVHHPLERVPAHEMDHVGAFELACERPDRILTDNELAMFGRRFSTDSAARKSLPLATGLLDYFPDACFDVARLSQIGNDKHNPGEPLHWSRGKSNDHRDTIMRHLAESGVVDTDGVLHDTKVAWRALAQLQISIERLRSKGVNYP